MPKKRKRSEAQTANSKGIAAARWKAHDLADPAEADADLSDAENHQPLTPESHTEPVRKRLRLSQPLSPQKRTRSGAGATTSPPERPRRKRARTLKETNAELLTANAQLKDEVGKLQDEKSELEEQLDEATGVIAHVTDERDKLDSLLVETEAQLKDECAAHEITAQDREYWRQRTKRLTRERKQLAKEKQTQLDQAASDLAAAVERHKRAKRRFKVAIEASCETIEELKRTIEEGEGAKEELTAALELKRKKLRMFQMRALRAKKTNMTHLERLRDVKKEKSARWLTTSQRGAYSPKTRKLVLDLLQTGVSAKHVGKLVQTAGLAFGVKVSHKLSARTVGRIAVEAGVMVDMQLAYNIMMVDPKKNEGIAVSDDSTSHRWTTYHAKHLTMPTPPYVSNPTSSHTVYVVAADQMLEHTAEGQIQSWVDKGKRFGGVWNAAPVARRLQKKYRSGTLFIKTTTRNSDQAADAHLLTDKWTARKKQLQAELLGEEVVAKLSDEEVDALVAEKCVLSPDFKLETRDAVILAVAFELGLDAFDRLSDDDQKRLTFVLQAGCCGHKDKNTVESFAKSLHAAFVALGLPLPITLPNAPNAAAIRADPEGAAAKQAEASSSGGAIKFLQILASICNNKDDKKGQQDFHRNFMTERKSKRFGVDSARVSAKFPGVSNNRYQGYPRAAIEVIVNLQDYRDFSEVVRLKKGTPGWTNIEANVNAALHDDATLTQLVCLAFYYLIISAPYMLAVRGAGTGDVNFCELGPLHDNARGLLEHLVEHPDLIFEPGLSSRGKYCTLDGEDWVDSHAAEAIESLIPKLPNIKPVLLYALRNSISDWEHYAREFEAGSDLDTMSQVDRLLHFCPSTNDACEGLLGSFRLWSRRNPSGSVATFSALAAFERNGTAEFADKFLTEAEDTAYVMAEARRRIESGEDRAFKKAQVEFEGAKAQAAGEKIETRDAKARARYDKLQALVPITDEMVIREELTSPQLKEQLDRLRIVEKDAVICGMMVGDYTNKAERISALLAAVRDRHRRGLSTQTPQYTPLTALPIVTERLPVEDDDDE